MSGGVDSAVSALLLKNAGYQVHAIFMRTWNAEDSINPVAECPWKTDLNDAKAVCEKLGITFEVVNMIANYRELVVKELVAGYRNGITPNPDVLCNAHIKFGALRQYARSNGFDKFATGHYCRTKVNSDGSINILEGIDKSKDQSYFLAMVSRDKLENVLFPIGEFRKSDVRKLAASAGLPNCKKKDSQGICFLGKVRIQDFLSNYIEDSPGSIVTANGKVLGQHQGLFRFTIGQRHGIGLPSNLDYLHYVVIGKNLEKNQLVVEIERPDSKFLYGREFFLRGLNFANGHLENHKDLLVRPRYRDPAVEIEFFPSGNDTACIIFKTPQRAIAPGQIAAFYMKEVLLGGGIFE
ncbi:MAG: tRNA 2-thiouridine(34) synthase MnmA [Puniceicoccales bacterium]|nr:tRNA 2-thiouridine(34) synthase MnmA [Puniceicoccales bacterium]